MKKSIACLLCLLLVIAMTACTPAVSTTTATSATTTTAKTTTATTATTEPTNGMAISPEPVTLTAAVIQDESYGRPTDEIWFWKYLSTFHNMNFEVEQILSSAIGERKSLMFASNMLPDLLLGLGITYSEYVKYGQNESQLLALNDYISQETTPNIIKLFADIPGSEAAVTLPNGKIYGLPIVGQIYNMGYYNGNCWWYNQNYFNEAGIDMPKTVEEMLEALRTLKEAAGTGTIPAELIPLGGSSNAQTPYWLLLNAFGFITSGAGFTSIALVDGQPQVICYDKERFPAFLQYIRTLYEEGLISQDFFSMDGTQVDGQKASGLYGVSSFLPALMPNKADSGSAADWSDFWAMGTLTSQYNTTGEVADIPSANRFSVGSFAASSSTADPALIARFADFWYSDEGTLISATRFPSFDQEMKYTLDMFTVRWNDEVGNVEAVFPDGKINTVEIGQSEYLTPVYPFLCYQDYMPILYKFWDKDYVKKYDDAAPSNWDPYRDAANVDRSNMDRWAVTIYDKFMPHTTGTAYPSIIYMDEETAVRAADINSLLDDYARQEFAKFVTGTREINETELADFFANLETMGIQEYLDYYTDAYKTYQ